MVRARTGRIHQRRRHHANGKMARRKRPSCALPREVVGSWQRALGRLPDGLHVASAVRTEAQPLRQGDAEGGSLHQAHRRRSHARRDGRSRPGEAHQRPICSRLSFAGRLDRPDAPQLPRQHRHGQRALLRIRHAAYRHEAAEEGAHRSSSVAHRVGTRAGRPGPREI